MELDTAAVGKQIRKRVAAHMEGRDFEVDHVQSEVAGTTETDSALRVLVWLTPPGEDNRSPAARGTSPRWDELTWLKEQLNTDDNIPDNAAAGLVSAGEKSRLKVVYPADEHDRHQFR